MQLLQTWIAPSSPSQVSSKCKSLLITLNPVGMLCVDQPMAPNLPPLLPSHLRSPFYWQSCKETDAAAAAAAAAARAAAVAAAVCHYYGTGVVSTAGPGVVLRRLTPTGQAAPSPGLSKPAPGPGVADLKHSCLRKAIQQLHAAASRTSRNRIKNPAG